MSHERAIVTAGGTKERIDDVRYIEPITPLALTNFAKGGFGYAIGKFLFDRGCDVTMICAEEVPPLYGYRLINVKHKIFTDADSLQEVLFSEPGADFVFHTAAVADFTPVGAVGGKISSGQEILTITCKRTPKIIAGLRDHFGEEAFLTGFKLLSHVPRQDLIEAAIAQNKKNRLDLTVANDLSTFHGGIHPVILIPREGEMTEVTGQKEDVAKTIVDFVKQTR